MCKFGYLVWRGSGDVGLVRWLVGFNGLSASVMGA